MCNTWFHECALFFRLAIAPNKTNLNPTHKVVGGFDTPDQIVVSGGLRHYLHIRPLHVGIAQSEHNLVAENKAPPTIVHYANITALSPAEMLALR